MSRPGSRKAAQDRVSSVAPAVEPLGGVEPLALQVRPRTIHPGLVLRVRGRNVRLRGLKREPAGLWRWLAVLGPGLIAGAVSNDAGSIATYSQAGAAYGYQLLWVILIITVSLVVVQEMSARLGAATGRGLLDLIRERFGIGWALLAVAVVMLADTGLIISEFVGIGAAAELLGVSRFIAIPVAAALLAYLVMGAGYSRVERIFILMALVFLAYPIAAVLARPSLGGVLHGTVVPTISRDPNYIVLLVGLIGTTISPYQQIFQQSTVVEKGVARRHYGGERLDTIVGMVFSSLVSFFIVVAVAATLYVAGTHQINSAADAARALEPVLGPSAKIIFAVGLLGASLMAAAILPLATAYSVGETFGFPKGMNLDFRRAPIFYGLFAALMVIGAGVALAPNLPVIQLLVGIQVLNGMMLPVILVFMLLLSNNVQLMGHLRNSRGHNVVGWATFAMVVVSVLALFVSQLLGA